MGIRNLNMYLRAQCKSPASIHPVHLSELSGKRIAVDASIYLYKYETDQSLFESMYTMLAWFAQFHVVPLFVFDGPPPAEKQELLLYRLQQRQDALDEWNQLHAQNEDNEARLKELRRLMVQISKQTKLQIKELIRAFGFSWIDAPGEADALCAWLVLQKHAWACMSDDTDLFVYGCPRVLRQFNLHTQRALLYHTSKCLKDLCMTQREFTQVCALSGTDYNSEGGGVDFSQSMALFAEFQTQQTAKALEFGQWAQHRVSTAAATWDNICSICRLFDLSQFCPPVAAMDHSLLLRSSPNLPQVVHLMEPHGFVFV